MFWLAAAEAAEVAPAASSLDVIFQTEARRLSPALIQPFLADPEAKVRARATRAVGRLKGPTSMLAKVLVDPDVEVRREAAFALGFTTDPLAQLRARWAEEGDREVRAALAESFGRQGAADDVDRMLRALAGPDGPAAALALGRMGMRKLDGAGQDRAWSALLDSLRIPVGDTRRNAAWAMARTSPGNLNADTLQRLRAAAAGDADPRVRAWLLRAAAAAGASSTWLAERAADPAPEVRIAVARAMPRAGCEAGAISRLAADADVGVRLEAVTAAGDCKKPDLGLLREHLAAGTPAERAAALRGLAKADALPDKLDSWMDPALPSPLRVAAVESLGDHKRLLQLARSDEDPRIRSAAAGAIVGAEAPKIAELVALLDAPDLVVAQAAADALAEHPDAAAERALLAFLGRADMSALAATSGIRALDAVYVQNPKLSPDPETLGPLQRWWTLPALRSEAARIAVRATLTPPQIVPDERPLPTLAEVETLRSARIFTEVGELRVELFPEEAPLTVWNFVTLAERHFFDGLVFHRVVPDFVIQAGDPRGDGWGGPGYEIPDELNAEPYSTGTLGMALSGPDTGGSQWFFTLAPQPHLDGGYTVFGRLTRGTREARAVQVGTKIERIVIERVDPT